jgi:hypothetical protein
MDFSKHPTDFDIFCDEVARILVTNLNKNSSREITDDEIYELIYRNDETVYNCYSLGFEPNDAACELHVQYLKDNGKLGYLVAVKVNHKESGNTVADFGKYCLN